MTQLSFLDAIDPPPTAIRTPVDPMGKVVPSREIQERIVLPHPKMVWHSAEIQLHKADNGLWMWATAAQTFNGGYSYQVGVKWGKFATQRRDAIWLAADEIQERIKQFSGVEIHKITKWCHDQKQKARQ